MIAKNQSITEIIETYPETAKVFMEHGMHCFGCMAARFENVEQGALAHGIDVEQLMTALNKAAH